MQQTLPVVLDLFYFCPFPTVSLDPAQSLLVSFEPICVLQATLVLVAVWLAIPSIVRRAGSAGQETC